MRWLLLAPVILILAGCMSDGEDIFHQSKAVKPEQPSIEQPQVAPAPNIVPLSPAARAAAPAGENLKRWRVIGLRHRKLQDQLLTQSGEAISA